MKLLWPKQKDNLPNLDLRKAQEKKKLHNEIHGSLQVQLKLRSNLKNHKTELHLILPETSDRETFEHIS